jgi:hypothetical protein
VTIRQRSPIREGRSGPAPFAVGPLASDATMVAGGACLAWSGGIHLDLWHLGYRTTPTIGTLFVLQSVAAFALALLVVAARRLLPALAGAGFLASTIGGLVWSAEWGLFGFREHLDAPFAVLSLTVEATGTVVLLGAAALRLRVARTSSGERRATARRG